MSIDKTQIHAPGVTAIRLNIDLRKIFTSYFDEVVEEICCNMLAKACTENWTPSQFEEESVRELSNACSVACRNKVRESVKRILGSKSPEQISQMIEELIRGVDHE